MRNVLKTLLMSPGYFFITNRWLKTKFYYVVKLFDNNYQFGLSEDILCAKTNAEGSNWVD